MIRAFFMPLYKSLYLYTALPTVYTVVYIVEYIETTVYKSNEKKPYQKAANVRYNPCHA